MGALLLLISGSVGIGSYFVDFQESCVQEGRVVFMGWSKFRARSVFTIGIRKIWNILFWGTLFGLVSMVIFVMAVPTLYCSAASVYVSDAAAGAPISDNPGSAEISDSYANSYLAVMKSEKAMKYIKKSLKSKMSTDMISGTIEVTQVDSTAIFTVTARYSDPQSTQMLAQTAAKAAVKSLQSVGVEATVLDKGTVPTYPESPNVLQNTLLALAAGIILRWLIAIIAALRYRSLQNREEWEETFDIPVLAEIPERFDK